MQRKNAAPEHRRKEMPNTITAQQQRFKSEEARIACALKFQSSRSITRACACAIKANRPAEGGAKTAEPPSASVASRVFAFSSPSAGRYTTIKSDQGKRKWARRACGFRLQSSGIAARVGCFASQLSFQWPGECGAGS